MKSRAIRTLPVLFAAFGGTQFASADLTFYDVFMTSGHQQIDATTAVFAGAYASEGIEATSAGDITDANVTRPNLTVDTLSQTGNNWSFQTVTYATEAALLSDFGTGNYQFSANGGSLQATLSVPNNLWTGNAPLVTNYNALQTINIAQDFTVDMTTFSPVLTANNPTKFYTLFDTTTNTTLFGGAGDGSTLNSFVIYANTLTAGDTYNIVLFDSDRQSYAPDANFGNATPFVGFDEETTVTFTAQATPEPASYLGLAGGMFGLAFARRRRNR